MSINSISDYPNSFINFYYSQSLSNTKFDLEGLKERIENVIGAFAVDLEEDLSGYRILLIDDVVTTGGTVAECAKALKRAGLAVKDLDVIELNEAFASQSLACINDLELDPKKVNINGGSISIGHPLGASGTRISATLIHEMQKRETAKYGLATMCIGVGQGAAVIYEKL